MSTPFLDEITKVGVSISAPTGSKNVKLVTSTHSTAGTIMTVDSCSTVGMKIRSSESPHYVANG